MNKMIAIYKCKYCNSLFTNDKKLFDRRDVEGITDNRILDADILISYGNRVKKIAIHNDINHIGIGEIVGFLNFE
jgi:hypothetical protein